MYLNDLYNIIGIDELDNNIYINNIVTNSGEVEYGDIFLCINSGYKYIESAIKRGCIGVIINKDIDINYDILTIRVDNTIDTLIKLARFKRDNYSGIVIAITGSMGKSTTKELLYHVLSKYNNVLHNINNTNNKIGISNTLLKLNNNYQYTILELGTNHKGEIKYLKDIIKPNISIITNIGHAHIGNFKSIKNILKEKLDIKYNTLIVNGEDEYLKNINAIKVYKDDYDYEPKIYFYKMNYYLVIKVLELIGFDLDTIYNNLDTFNNINSRMNIITKNNITIIDDAYNASYESIINGLEYINKYKRKIIILSEMLEIGKYKNRLYKNIFNYINNMDNVILITIGKDLLKYNKLHFNDINEIIDYISNIKYNDGDVIYIKGAHAYNLSSLVKYIELNLNI